MNITRNMLTMLTKLNKLCSSIRAAVFNLAMKSGCFISSAVIDHCHLYRRVFRAVALFSDVARFYVFIHAGCAPRDHC